MKRLWDRENWEGFGGKEIMPIGSVSAQTVQQSLCCVDRSMCEQNLVRTAVSSNTVSGPMK